MKADVNILRKTKVKRRGQLRSIWNRYKRNKLAMVGLFLMALLVFFSLSAHFIVDYDKAIHQNMQERFQEPSLKHIFGTDQYGRDIFARIIHGAKISIFMGLFNVAIALTIGSIIGSVAGYYGGYIDGIVMRIMDVFLAIPQTLLAISIVAVLGQGVINLMIALIISAIPKFARIVRSAILTVRGQEYIEAARAYGTNDMRIIFKHVMPNAIGPIIVQATLDMAFAILSIASLSFLGLGISPPTPEWGSMLSEGKTYMRDYSYLVVFPGIAIVITVLALNLIGDGLRDALDPRLRN
ncbi:MAG: ABC transporter permease [Firmicutes bacterium]|nr:ABC transporter permease [Bacillota bacterium]